MIDFWIEKMQFNEKWKYGPGSLLLPIQILIAFFELTRFKKRLVGRVGKSILFLFPLSFKQARWIAICLLIKFDHESIGTTACGKKYRISFIYPEMPTL